VAGYLEAYGHESWELDALDPATLDALIEEHVEGLRDDELWDHMVQEEQRHVDLLSLASRHWGELVEFLDGVE
jgi:hypothetical protein